MRLIDADAFREDYALGERCKDCRRFGKKDCDYPNYSARDFCGWLDDAPTVELTDEAAIEHLQASGWMQRHDRAMTRPPWISVDEIPPEIHKSVLLAVYGHDVIVQKPGESLMDALKRVRKTVRYTTMGSLEEDGWYGADGYPMVVQPSYWALLPEPPEEEKDA